MIANTDGPLPVSGSAGCGKSHLIRWVHSALLRHPESGKFHIVRIKKNASLRSALESILEGLDSEEFEVTRADVAKLQQDQTPLSVAQQLVFYMGQQVGLRCRSLAKELLQTVRERGHNTPEESDLLSFYGVHGHDTNGLSHLVTDPYFQSTFLKEDTPVFKYANRLVGGKDGVGVDEEDIHDFSDSFTLGHFGFSEIDIAKLSEPARTYLTHSQVHTDAKVASDVVALLSDSLSVAINTYFEKQFKYGGGSFQDLFRDIRKYLKSINKEMFVLVEDLAAIKAISDTLIDCLLEDPDDSIAPVHSVIASTSGAQAYQLTRDTIISRSGGEWLMDVDEQDVAEKEIIDQACRNGGEIP